MTSSRAFAEDQAGASTPPSRPPHRHRPSPPPRRTTVVELQRMAAVNGGVIGTLMVQAQTAPGEDLGCDREAEPSYHGRGPEDRKSAAELLLYQHLNPPLRRATSPLILLRTNRRGHCTCGTARADDSDDRVHSLCEGDISLVFLSLP